MRPRDSLPPTNVPGPTIDQLAEIERARRDAEDSIDTLVPCPACERCNVCLGTNMVSADAYALWREKESPP